jgi:hypothetical protein
MVHWVDYCQQFPRAPADDSCHRRRNSTVKQDSRRDPIAVHSSCKLHLIKGGGCAVEVYQFFHRDKYSIDALFEKGL